MNCELVRPEIDLGIQKIKQICTQDTVYGHASLAKYNFSHGGNIHAIHRAAIDLEIAKRYIGLSDPAFANCATISNRRIFGRNRI